MEMIVTGSPEYLAIGRASSIEFIPDVKAVPKEEEGPPNYFWQTNIQLEIEDAAERFLSVLSRHDLDEDLLDKLHDYHKWDAGLLTQIPSRPSDRYEVKSDSSAASHHEDECAVTGSYYLPLMRYVTSHYGDVETGVGTPDSVLLAEVPSPDDIFMNMGGVGGAAGGGAGGRSTGATGMNSVVESSLREHFEAEAAAGNPNALMWLGIRSYWGNGGLPANATTARMYLHYLLHSLPPFSYSVQIF
jgi:hypothetical protein